MHEMKLRVQVLRPHLRAVRMEPCHWSEGRHNYVGGVTAGKASHNASDARGVTAGKMGRNSSLCNLHCHENVVFIHTYTFLYFISLLIYRLWLVE